MPGFVRAATAAGALADENRQSCGDPVRLTYAAGQFASIENTPPEDYPPESVTGPP